MTPLRDGVEERGRKSIRDLLKSTPERFPRDRGRGAEEGRKRLKVCGG
jgi:hypothetical protein